MPDCTPLVAPLLSLCGAIPLDCLQPHFMRQALIGLLLLCPMTAALGVQVVHFRMAFFSDAIGHSAFAGAALGLMLSVDPLLAMPIFGILVGFAVMAVQRRAALSSDAAIGIVFSAVVAFGLAAVSRAPGMARTVQQFLYGDILTISTNELVVLALLGLAVLAFQFAGYNRLLLIALNPIMARASGIRVALWQYLFAGLTALAVMFAVRAVGVLLVTALLIVPAAAARHFARTAGGMFWWAQAISATSGIAGLLLSAQPWLATSSGATIILVTCLWFAFGVIPRRNTVE